MNEAEGSAGVGVWDKLAVFANDPRMQRKCLLFSAACCRRLWHRLARLPVGRRVIELAEAYADGLIAASVMHDEYPAYCTEHRRGQARSRAANPMNPLSMLFPDLMPPGAVHVPRLVRAALKPSERDREEQVQAALFREVFGDPLRPVTVDPSWRTSAAVALAQGIYEERAFDRMPILADALEDAGCDDDEVIAHCRDEKATHVRGCWVVDLVLGP